MAEFNIPEIHVTVAAMTRSYPTATTASTSRLADLLAEHSELMSGRALWHALGFRSERSFQRAVQQGTLPVPVFTQPSRRGRFARTRDIAAWLDGVVIVEDDETPDQSERGKFLMSRPRFPLKAGP